LPSEEETPGSLKKKREEGGIRYIVASAGHIKVQGGGGNDNRTATRDEGDTDWGGRRGRRVYGSAFVTKVSGGGGEHQF